MKILIRFLIILSIFNLFCAENLSNQTQLFLKRIEDASELEKKISEKIKMIEQAKSQFEHGLQKYVNDQLSCENKNIEIIKSESSEIYSKLKKNMEDEVGQLFKSIFDSSMLQNHALLTNLPSDLDQGNTLGLLKFELLKYGFYLMHLEILTHQWKASLELLGEQ